MAVDAGEISVGEVSRVFEGEATASERLLALCALDGNKPSCAIWAWRIVADQIRERLDEVTIKQLVNQIRKQKLGEAQ